MNKLHIKPVFVNTTNNSYTHKYHIIACAICQQFCKKGAWKEKRQNYTDSVRF